MIMANQQSHPSISHQHTKSAALSQNQNTFFHPNEMHQLGGTIDEEKPNRQQRRSTHMMVGAHPQQVRKMPGSNPKSGL